jgi:Transcriptional regulators
MDSCLEDLSQNLSLKDRVYNIIKDQIIMGNLKPGERLREEELSKAMKISRAPIREALNRLERESFAELIPRKGAIVTSVSKKDIEDILKMRILLEPFAASESIQSIPEEEIDSVEKILLAVRKDPSNFSAYIHSDIALHELLYKHLDNKIMKDTLTRIKEHSLRIRYLAEIQEDIIDQGIIATSITEHLEILAAIKERNAAKLATLVKQHLQNAEERALLTVLEK